MIHSEATPIPTILIIDDREGKPLIQASLENGQLVRVLIRHPNDVADDDLKKATLILVDYQLDNWPERDNLPSVALKPKDGLALAAILRRQMAECPIGIAIHTGQIQAMAQPLPPEHREHILARVNNLEWVFQKGKQEGHPVLVTQLYSLAMALERLPKKWEPPSLDRPLGPLAELFSLDANAENFQRFVDEVLACRPPLHELSQWSHGLAVIRWFLHRILPYPCFLWDIHRMASRLRIDPKRVRLFLETGKPLNVAFQKAEYKGMLSDFLGPRWWRCEVESILWRETHGKSADAGAVQKWIASILGENLVSAPEVNRSVVCLNQDLQPVDELITYDEAVKILPDDWPPFADQAWTSLTLAKEDPLKSMVAPDDLAFSEALPSK